MVVTLVLTKNWKRRSGPRQVKNCKSKLCISTSSNFIFCAVSLNSSLCKLNYPPFKGMNELSCTKNATQSGHPPPTHAGISFYRLHKISMGGTGDCDLIWRRSWGPLRKTEWAITIHFWSVFLKAGSHHAEKGPRHLFGVMSRILAKRNRYEWLPHGLRLGHVSGWQQNWMIFSLPKIRS